MTLLLVALAILGVSGIAALALARSPGAATAAGAGGAVLAAAVGLVPAVQGLGTATPERLHAAWDVPYASFALELDPLSAFFLLPILILSALAAVYGTEYLRGAAAHRSLGPVWFFYDVLVASMVLVVLARNAVLFLVAWEGMALASYFLVTFEDEKEDVRQAGWTYLVATHLGTAFLVVMFLVLGRGSDRLDFDRMAAGGLPSATAGLAFALAVVGFGTKAGFMPLHVWLPEAHPAAPSHVSALLSGVMIKIGIYGLLRTLTLLGPPPAWWGWVLLAIGLSSGILGVLFALAQHDLKRLLAYHSVENIGIIALGLGLGLLGVAKREPFLAVLGFAGGLLHVANHALFKGLLFLGAGAAALATGTRDMDRLGGLGKRMPWTAASFLVGAVAISGLPPFNGFASEFLVFLAGFLGVLSPARGVAFPALAAVVGLALIGGLAAACFTKAFGAVFLGEPRHALPAGVRDPGPAMRAPMAFLAAACLAVGLAAPLLVGGLAPVVASLAALPLESVRARLAVGTGSLGAASAIGATLVALGIAGALLRRALVAGRSVSEAGTWDCGYALPTPRMQYTSSSFAQPLTHLFGAFLRTRRRLEAPRGLFPPGAAYESHTPDACREGLFRPAFEGVAWVLARFRWIQGGSLHVYVLYIAATLALLLLWKLG